MFSLPQEQLLYSLRPAASFHPTPPASDRRAWSGVEEAYARSLVQRAERAREAPLPVLTAGDFLEADGEAGPPAAYVARREQLKALVLGALLAGPERYLARIADLLLAICEETSWAAPRKAERLPHFGAPDVDARAAGTAALLAFAGYLLRGPLDAVSPLFCRRIGAEVRRRVTGPLAEREGLNFLRLSEGEMPGAAADLLLSSLLVEEEDAPRWLCLRKILRLLERYLERQLPDGGFSTSLEAHVRETLSLADCFEMLGAASGGEVELRDEPLFVNRALLPLYLHAGGGWFFNPGDGLMRPRVDPQALFRLGEAARSTQLCNLAAYLNRQRRSGDAPFERPGDSLYQMARLALSRADFLREPARASLLSPVLLPKMQALSARAGGFYAALRGGAGAHRDVGQLVLFCAGEPVLIDLGLLPDARLHGVPALEGVEQQAPARRADEPELVRERGYTLLSVGVAHAFPPEANLAGWQRTVLLSEGEGAGEARLIDAFDFDGAPRKAVFRFLTPRPPQIGEDGLSARLGGVSMRWQDGLDARASAERLTDPALRALWGETVHRLELVQREAAPSGNYTILFAPC